MRLPSDLRKFSEYQLSRWRDRIEEKIDELGEELERIDEWVESNKEKFGNDGIDYPAMRLMAAKGIEEMKEFDPANPGPPRGIEATEKVLRTKYGKRVYDIHTDTFSTDRLEIIKNHWGDTDLDIVWLIALVESLIKDLKLQEQDNNRIIQSSKAAVESLTKQLEFHKKADRQRDDFVFECGIREGRSINKIKELEAELKQKEK